MMNATRKDIRPFVFTAVSPSRGHAGSPQTQPPSGPIVVGVEMSAAGRRAAFDAALVAAATGAPVHLVLAVNRAWSRIITGGGTEEWNINWLTTAEQFLDDLMDELPIESLTRAVIIGAPAKAVRNEAERINARQVVVPAPHLRSFPSSWRRRSGDVTAVHHARWRFIVSMGLRGHDESDQSPHRS